MLYINWLGTKIAGNERSKILQVRRILRITTHLLRVAVALRLPVSEYPPRSISGFAVMNADKQDRHGVQWEKALSKNFYGAWSYAQAKAGGDPLYALGISQSYEVRTHRQSLSRDLSGSRLYK